jgi:hypothetical protein
VEKSISEKTIGTLSKWTLMMAVSTGVAGISLWMTFKKSIPPQIPLWYSRPWGEEQLAAPVYLVAPAALAIGVGILTAVAAGRLREDRVLAAMILASGIVIEVIMILGILRIILLAI